ncbi:hypothetical protein V498_08515 [Pseudogymnoascus sp. VKM F-4517 (FW-2822)]|nr:hypothetical protein V498_08515 [Pseudogymnoascus sp. VKM F-4517 (FW-2822)]
MAPPNMSSFFTFAELPAGSDRATELAMRLSWHKDEFDRPCRSFLKRLRQRDEKWGFTIYRTVYTPGSDALFQSVLEKIKDCLAISLRSELQSIHWRRDHPRAFGTGETPPPLISAGPCDQVEDQYEPLVIEDREVWDGASIEDVRAHFRDTIFLEFLRSGDIAYGPAEKNTIPHTPLAQDPKTSICLVIDMEALISMVSTGVVERGVFGLREEDLLASPVDPKEYMESRPLRWGKHGFVKGVDADWPRHDDIWGNDDNEPSMLGRRNGIPDPPRRVSRYQGWKRVGCEALWGQYNDELRDGGRLGR